MIVVIAVVRVGVWVSRVHSWDNLAVMVLQLAIAALHLLVRSLALDTSMMNYSVRFLLVLIV
jgi:hypothetical protein